MLSSSSHFLSILEYGEACSLYQEFLLFFSPHGSTLSNDGPFCGKHASWGGGASLQDFRTPADNRVERKEGRKDFSRATVSMKAAASER
jgi:hypothetical protein